MMRETTNLKNLISHYSVAVPDKLNGPLGLSLVDFIRKWL
jgi:hypothetical protein